MRKGIWIAVIIGVVAACGFGIKAHAAAQMRYRRAPPRPTSPCPRRKTSRSASPTTRASGSSSTSTPRTRPRAAPSKPTTSSATWPSTTPLNAVVLGVSLDTVESHKTWCSKDTFTFKLLADPDHKVVDAYGVPVDDPRRHEVCQPRHLPHLARRQGRQGLGEGRRPDTTATKFSPRSQPTRSNAQLSADAKRPGPHERVRAFLLALVRLR